MPLYCGSLLLSVHSEIAKEKTSLPKFMSHILIVCTANICRSPLVEVIVRDRLAKNQQDWQVSSAGTWAGNGYEASANSVVMAESYGMELADHRSRRVTERMLRTVDLVLCMAKSHVEDLRTDFPDYTDKVFLLSEMSGQKHDVADPYGKPLHEYEKMGNEVTKLVDNGWERIVAYLSTHTVQANP